jgi:hypothetical protein
MEERTNIKQKTCQPTISKGLDVNQIKGYAKTTEHQLKEHMEYDGMNKD